PSASTRALNTTHRSTTSFVLLPGIVACANRTFAAPEKIDSDRLTILSEPTLGAPTFAPFAVGSASVIAADGRRYSCAMAVGNDAPFAPACTTSPFAAVEAAAPPWAPPRPFDAPLDRGGVPEGPPRPDFPPVFATGLGAPEPPPLLATSDLPSPIVTDASHGSTPRSSHSTI